MSKKFEVEKLFPKKSSSQLGFYEVDRIEKLFAKIRHIFENTIPLIEQNDAAFNAKNDYYHIFKAEVQHLKRVLLNYHIKRLYNLKDCNSPRAAMRNTKHLLTKSEVFFLNELNTILDRYLCGFDGISFNSFGLSNPPNDLFVQAVAANESEEVYTKSGMINLQQGAFYFLKRSDVQELIVHGVLSPK